MPTGSIDPSRPQFEAFKALPRGTPIQMLNLIRLKPLAEYPADHPNHGKGMSGLDAYRAYGRDSAEVFARVGGRQVWAGRPEAVVTVLMIPVVRPTLRMAPLLVSAM